MVKRALPKETDLPRYASHAFNLRWSSKARQYLVEPSLMLSNYNGADDRRDLAGMSFWNRHGKGAFLTE